MLLYVSTVFKTWQILIAIYIVDHNVLRPYFLQYCNILLPNFIWFCFSQELNFFHLYVFLISFFNTKRYFQNENSFNSLSNSKCLYSIKAISNTINSLCNLNRSFFHVASKNAWNIGIDEISVLLRGFLII